MEELRAEAARRRKELEAAKQKRATPYVTRGAIEAEAAAAKRRKAADATAEAAAAAAKLRMIEDLRTGRSSTAQQQQQSTADLQQTEQQSGKATLPEREVIRRLRQRGQPITLFGEDADARAARLSRMEEQEPMEYVAGAGNELLRLFRSMERSQQTAEKKKEEEKSESDKDEDGEKRAETPATTEEEKVRRFFVGLLEEWERMLRSKGEEQLRTRAGMQAHATFRMCRDNLQPLFDLLRRRTVPADVLQHVSAIVALLREREYVRANDEYLAMAIGNAPWPMGVTMVGIHERSAREKIFSTSVAHVLNDETTRKYLQSVKRLITFAQRRYPTDPSRSVEWNAFDL